MNVGEEEAEAVKRATNQVANMLQRSDQLQKVEQLKRRVERKNLSVEAMLKTAMQSQLDGVRTGLGQLQTALVDLKEIKSGLAEIEGNLGRIPELSKNLASCRDEYLKHSQYAAAMENLKHIFTVPESIEKTRLYISEGKLLNAHQCIMDLENSRDDLLFELHKLPHQNPNETRLLKEYFSEVQTLSDELGKQVWIIVQRTLNTVRKEPTQIVTAFRIIEREERSDIYALNRQKSNGFLPPDRPKNWREKAFEVLEKVVAQRIECNQFESRENNKNWLIRHLEVIRVMLLEDLKVVGSQCVNCFPPSYDIVSKFVEMYHQNLSSHLVQKVEEGLEENEYVTLLAWVMNTYKGKDLMGNSFLNFDMSHFGPLLENDILDNLQSRYIENVSSNYESWMGRALEMEQTEWTRKQPPQQDGEGHYKTELPQILHDMIQQNLEVASTISTDVLTQVLDISFSHVSKFADKFRSALTSYKVLYFSDRSKIQYYTTYMIALGNSCQALVDIMSQIKKQYYKPVKFSQFDRNVATQYEELMRKYHEIRDLVCDYLLDEALTDLHDQFSSLVTQRWLNNPEPMDTICETIKDYFQDYTRLHPKNFEHIVVIALNIVTTRYITAIFQKRINIKTDEDRKKVAERIQDDANNLQSIFDSIAPDVMKYNCSCEAIRALTEILISSDLDFLSLEIHRLLSRYPDLTPDHLTSLLLLRGDIGRLDVRQRVAESFEELKNQRPSATASTKSIFSRVAVSTSLF